MSAPDRGLKLLTGHHAAGPAREMREHLGRLMAQLDEDAGLAQLAARGSELEHAEAETPAVVGLTGVLADQDERLALLGHGH